MVSSLHLGILIYWNFILVAVRGGGGGRIVGRERVSDALPEVFAAGFLTLSLLSPVGLQHQGIFRVSGSQVEVNDIKNSFERGNWMSLPISKMCWKPLSSVFCPAHSTLSGPQASILHRLRCGSWGTSYFCEKQKSLWAWSLGLGFALTAHGMCQGGTWQF